MELSSLHERIQAVVGTLTYRALAEATNQHPETVRRYMQGQAPSAEFLSALCFRFDINAQWLLTGQGPPRHTETRAHALREANPSELLAAIAAALERLTDRVDRIELFVQTLESTLRGRGQPSAETVPAEAEIRETKARTNNQQPTPHAGAAAKRVADALAERSRPDAD
ncbi:MAG: helix-turn-helix transcriptional regulator [Phycisphaerae bacterium]|nr:helix-turn-helix transcriptional regulator [Phycisphaerae bacterium]